MHVTAFLRSNPFFFTTTLTYTNKKIVTWLCKWRNVRLCNKTFLLVLSLGSCFIAHTNLRAGTANLCMSYIFKQLCFKKCFTKTYPVSFWSGHAWDSGSAGISLKEIQVNLIMFNCFINQNFLRYFQQLFSIKYGDK